MPFFYASGFGGYLGASLTSTFGCSGGFWMLFIIGFLGCTGIVGCWTFVEPPVASFFHASSKLKFIYFLFVAGDFIVF